MSGALGEAFGGHVERPECTVPLPNNITKPSTSAGYFVCAFFIPCNLGLHWLISCIYEVPSLGRTVSQIAIAYPTIHANEVDALNHRANLE